MKAELLIGFRRATNSDEAKCRSVYFQLMNAILAKSHVGLMHTGRLRSIASFAFSF